MQIISVWRHCPIWRHSFATLPSAMGEKYNIFLLVSSWAYSLSLVSFAAFRFDFPTFVLVSFALSLLSSLPLFTITLSCVSLMLHSNGNRWQVNYCKTFFVGNCTSAALCAWSWLLMILVMCPTLKVPLGEYSCTSTILLTFGSWDDWTPGCLVLSAECAPLSLVSNYFPRFSKILLGVLILLYFKEFLLYNQHCSLNHLGRSQKPV